MLPALDRASEMLVPLRHMMLSSNHLTRKWGTALLMSLCQVWACSMCVQLLDSLAMHSDLARVQAA
jgi:hypothetical protein